MQSRRDHLHAYQFATGRLASALVSGDPGTGEAPMRRSGLGAAFGVMIAALLVIVAVVYGLLKPVNTHSWERTGALIVEKETGTRYIYVNGQLHPTANYSSALLALGGTPSVQDVSRAHLADVPRGTPLGIPGAPDDIAQPSALLTGAWTDCLHPGSGPGEVLDFDARSARPMPGNARVLMSGPDGTPYVLWQGTKYPISGRSALIAIGLDTKEPVKAPSAWLDALPTGTAIAPAAIPGAGTGSRTVAGGAAQTGQVFRTAVSGDVHYYVLKSDGMAPLTATEAALIAAAPGGSRPRQVSPADIAAVQASADHSLLHRIPDLLDGTDGTADGGAALCLLQSVHGSRLSTSVVRETGRAAAAGSAVLVPPEHAVLATPPKSPSDPNTPDPYLITDQGLKYQLAGQSAQALGFGSVQPRVLPQSTLDQITNGPRLSRAQAAQAVPGAN
ncbi:type VII secretion protein EccB [Streptomyces sp. NPDC007162]|uniref:type VII secretion protein EccB n=1 Tax=Streptomyces sp. NPDC007162 TaxID=3156917 RepID=UPI0033F0264B